MAQGRPARDSIPVALLALEFVEIVRGISLFSIDTTINLKIQWSRVVSDLRSILLNFFALEILINSPLETREIVQDWKGEFPPLGNMTGQRPRRGSDFLGANVNHICIHYLNIMTT